MEYQKTQKTWDFMKDHSRWEGLAKKMKIYHEKEFNQIEKDGEKKNQVTFHK